MLLVEDTIWVTIGHGGYTECRPCANIARSAELARAMHYPDGLDGCHLAATKSEQACVICFRGDGGGCILPEAEEERIGGPLPAPFGAQDAR